MYAPASPHERIASALAAGAVVACVGYALVTGLGYGVIAHGRDALVSVIFDPERPKPPPEPKSRPKPSADSAPKGVPAPKNLRNKAAQVVAPPPRLVIAPPSPMPVATVTPGVGNAAQTGASDLPGPGQGAGGEGNGLGGGGDGGDGDGRAATGPRQIRGKLSYRDLPQGVLEPGGEARVGVRYWVDTDGRVRGCRVDEPSGYPGIDAMTCRMIEQRFVYRPARNRAGRPVRVPVVEWHTWFSKEEGD